MELYMEDQTVSQTKWNEISIYFFLISEQTFCHLLLQTHLFDITLHSKHCSSKSEPFLCVITTMYQKIHSTPFTKERSFFFFYETCSID